MTIEISLERSSTHLISKQQEIFQLCSKTYSYHATTIGQVHHIPQKQTAIYEFLHLNHWKLYKTLNTGDRRRASVNRHFPFGQITQDILWCV